MSLKRAFTAQCITFKDTKLVNEELYVIYRTIRFPVNIYSEFRKLRANFFSQLLNSFTFLIYFFYIYIVEFEK